MRPRPLLRISALLLPMEDMGEEVAPEGNDDASRPVSFLDLLVVVLAALLILHGPSPRRYQRPEPRAVDGRRGAQNGENGHEETLSSTRIALEDDSDGDEDMLRSTGTRFVREDIYEDDEGHYQVSASFPRGGSAAPPTAAGKKAAGVTFFEILKMILVGVLLLLLFFLFLEEILFGGLRLFLILLSFLKVIFVGGLHLFLILLILLLSFLVYIYFCVSATAEGEDAEEAGLKEEENANEEAGLEDGEAIRQLSAHVVSSRE